MALRPDHEESLQGLADQLVWAFTTYGLRRGSRATARPSNQENFQALADQVIWALTP